VVTTSEDEVSVWNITNGKLMWNHGFAGATQIYIADSALYVANEEKLSTYKLLKGLEMNARKYTNKLLGIFTNNVEKYSLEQESEKSFAVT